MLLLLLLSCHNRSVVIWAFLVGQLRFLSSIHSGEGSCTITGICV